jgi:hypothetical protein
MILLPVRPNPSALAVYVGVSEKALSDFGTLNSSCMNIGLSWNLLTFQSNGIFQENCFVDSSNLKSVVLS